MTEPEACPSPLPLERLSAFLDGDLGVAEGQSVRRHLEGCSSCAGRAAELRATVRAARALEAPEPPPTLWPAIEGALERGPRGWLPWRSFGVGVLAGAAAVAAAVFAISRSPSPDVRSTAVVAPAVVAAAPVDPLLVEAEREFTSAAAVYERSIEKLRALLAREEGRWSPEVRSHYSERLSRLDEAISRSREAARRSPSDAVGNEQLFAAYQQKIAFLTEAVHRGGTRRQGTP